MRTGSFAGERVEKEGGAATKFALSQILPWTDDCIWLICTVSPSSTVPPKSFKLLFPPISPAAPGTLYEQIVSGLKRAIGDGKLTPGDALPSFRQLAEEMLVSVITVKRAYEELEHEGIIFRRQGLGTFVAENGGDRSREVKIEHARTLLKTAAREAAEAGLKPAELRRLFLETLNEKS